MGLTFRYRPKHPNSKHRTGGEVVVWTSILSQVRLDYTDGVCSRKGSALRSERSWSDDVRLEITDDPKPSPNGRFVDTNMTSHNILTSRQF
jgi:hypothetical protein